MSDARVKQAFKNIREGRSPEYVVCDVVLNKKFLAETRQLGFLGSDAEINIQLINLRKQGRLKDCPTTNRKKPDPKLSTYRNAVSNSARFVERQFGKNVDDVICDPKTRMLFDAMVQFLSPGASAFESQYAALNLRKSNRLKPEPIGQILRAVSSDALSLSDLEGRLHKLPNKPGVYIFFDELETLYVGMAKQLRSRITDHVSNWLFRDLLKRMQEGRRNKVFIVYHELPSTVSASELRACEAELIRSRNPGHNRVGRAME
jgi:hypothetical protein